MTTIDRRYSVAEGTAFKAPCRVATTANISLTGLQSIDGVAVAENDRVLVKNQTAASENGIYGASTGNWSRTKDFDGAYDIVRGTKVFVVGGSTEYTVTSADPITIGSSSITFEEVFNESLLDAIDEAQAAADAALAAAEAAAASAAGSAAALGNQAYTFDYYALAAAATVPVGVKSLRLMGYLAAGDGPQSTYYRVASQPSTINRLRTTDRFLPNGSTSAGNGGWWQMVLDDLTDVRKYGIFGDGSTDVTTLLKGAITAGNVLIPAASGNYVLSADVDTFVSNRHFLQQRGATIVNTGGRFTVAVAGIHDVHLEIDGVISFVTTSTSPAILDWPTSPTNHRGVIEMGGTHASPGYNLKVTGSGRVYADYIWAGIPSTFANQTYALNRKGIAFINAYNCLCEGMEVDHIHGEAIYFNGYENSFNIKFIKNYVHHCSFDALNFNTSLANQGLLIAHNYVWGAYAGCELSGGTCDNNHFDNCHIGVQFGEGAGIGPLRVTSNAAVSCDVGYDFRFSPTAVENVVILGNEAITSASNAYLLDYLKDFQFKNNSSYNHANTSAGKAYTITVNCTNGHMDGNMTMAAGGSSTGNFSNSAGGTVTVGTNPVV